MKLTGHGNGVAIALAGLAVVLAATGTAYAVTATKVYLTDPGTPKNIARVDSKGHLLVTTQTVPVSTIDSNGLLYGIDTDNFVTSPTTATLAITKISFSESNANTPSAATELRVYVYRNGVDSAGKCAVTGYTQLAIYQLSAGDDIVDPYSQPLIVKPSGGKKYCLNFYVTQLGSSAGLSFLPSYQLTGYVVSGTYAGAGVTTAAGAHPRTATGRDHR